jgi:NADP-dependent 3-hydroxy acid dehydrogenase YdfG
MREVRNVASQGLIRRLDSDDLRSLLDLNVVSVHIVTVAVLRQSMLKNGGRIVNISSRDGTMGLPAVSFNMNATARSGKHRNLLIAAVDTTSRLCSYLPNLSQSHA